MIDRGRGALFVTLALLAGAAPSPAEPASPLARHRLADRLQSCRVPGLAEEVLGGHFEVFEDRRSGSGRRLALHVVVLPARAASPAEDAVVFLAGPDLRPATRFAPLLAAALAGLRAERDILLVDQRGTGESNPLVCHLPDPCREPALAQDGAAWRAAVRRCRDTLSEHADLRLYTTPLAMDDLYDVCQWLGYRRIDLWGMSYGTKAARVYVRQHPDHVRTLVLHGVVPLAPPMAMDRAASAQRALDQVLADCARDSICRADFPHLRSELDSLFVRLAETPVRLDLDAADLGHDVALSLDDTLLRDRIDNALLSWRTIVELPVVVHAAYGGDYAPLGRWLHTSDGDAAPGAATCILCSEDMPLVDTKKATTAALRTFLGDAALRRQIAACNGWPRGGMPAGYYEPLVSQVPTLLLTGEFDHLTPPEYAEKAAWHLGASRHVLLPGRGHDDLDAGVFDLIASFIRAGNAATLDTGGLQKPLRFVQRSADLAPRSGP